MVCGRALSKGGENQMLNQSVICDRSIKIAAAALLLSAAACASPEQKVERYTKSGESFLEKGKLGMANVQFQNALKIDEAHVPALVGISKIAEKRNDLQAMFGVLQRIIRADPDNARAQIDLAKLYLLSNQPTESLDLIDAALKRNGDDAEAIGVKSAVLFRLQNPKEAVALAKKAISINPASEEAVAVLAGERVQAKDFEAALAFLDAAIAKKSDSPVMQLLRVQVLSQMGRADDVLAAYRTLVEQFPSEVNYRRLYVSALVERDDLSNARAQLVEIAKLTPKQLESKVDIVRIDNRIGGAKKAEATFRQLIGDDPSNTELKFAFAEFLRQQKDFGESEKILNAILATRGVELDDVLRAKNDLAIQRVLENRRPDAEKLIDEILEEEPRNPDALLRRAGFRIDAGEFDSAIGDLRTVLNDRPDSAPAKIIMATALERKGDLDFAETELAQAVEITGKAALPSNYFARFLARKGDVARAEKVLTDSLASAPADVENLKLLASIRLQQQNWRGAEEVAQTLKTVEKQDGIVSSILGAAYSGLKDYAGAIDVLKSENDRAPLSARPLANLVQAYANAGRLDEAEAFLNQTIEGAPKNYEARLLLAQVQTARRSLVDAETTLRAAIEATPERSEAYESLYQMLALSGRREAAGEAIDAGLARSPEDDGLLVYKADHLIAISQPEAALPIYESILKRRPNDLLVANNFVSVLLENPTKANVARALVASQPLKGADNPYFVDTYGWTLFNAGKVEESLPFLKRAAESGPKVAEIRHHYGLALWKSGQKTAAKAEFEAVIKSTSARPEQQAEARRLLAE